MKKLLAVIILLMLFQTLYSGQVSQNDEEVNKIVSPILENILSGIEKKDYKTYSKDFDEAMKEALTESKFEATQKQINTQFGKITVTKYLGFLNKGSYTQVIWKGKCDKNNDDVLIQLVVSKRKDGIYIVGLWFK